MLKIGGTLRNGRVELQLARYFRFSGETPPRLHGENGKRQSKLKSFYLAPSILKAKGPRYLAAGTIRPGGEGKGGMGNPILSDTAIRGNVKMGLRTSGFLP